MPATPYLPDEVWRLVFQFALDSVRFEGMCGGAIDMFENDDDLRILRALLDLRNVCRRFDVHILSVFVERVRMDTSLGLFGFLQLYPTFMIRVTLELALRNSFRGSCGLVDAVRSTADYMVTNLPHDDHRNKDVLREHYMKSLCGAALVHLTDSRMSTKLWLRNWNPIPEIAARDRALVAASLDNDTELINLLLERAANVNHEDIYFGNALYTAVFLRNTEATSLLLANKASLLYSDMSGKTALHIAAQKGYDECVELVLNQTSRNDVDRFDHMRRTALSWAAEEGRVKVVELLLKVGSADPQTHDSRGVMPLDFAVAEGHHDVVKLLTSYRLDRRRFP
ncbi:uncharacterized protein PADG_06163 [Paracoccidioides brasiliensis Pb18]|uniref:Uncharacterized protein n=1 Tax=Paracoccidioides brasiliensis (strain Pb18) TaxID=502780 RepID=C1GFX7_PARBD|nr:uncharacterized protein PADG_06163 [Paracoccidioides brasiliensis Pb18]EEH50084.1 hypothetical protein PADG_06163 [Paracoccidioides brasiliensis Pb18]ODH51217.1 hypothetical protein GX48_02644 [Paracoccidioides brasiliensis]